MRLIKIMAKNLKILIRSRSAASIILIGPLCILLFAGLAFNNVDPVALTLGVSGAQTSTAQNFTQALDEEYTVFRYDSIQTCEAEVKSGKIHACLVYPQGFSIAPDKQDTIQIYVDGSRANIAGLIQNSLFGVIESESSQITQGLTLDLVTNIELTQQEISEYQKSYMKQLSDQSTTLIEQFNIVQQNLQSVNVSYDDDKLSLRGVEATVSEIDDFASEIKDQARDANQELSSFSGDVLDLNVSSSLNNLAQNAYTIAEKIDDELLNLTNNLEQSQDQLVGDVRIANSLLLELKEQLTLAQQQKDTVNTQIGTQQESINQMQQTLQVYASDLNTTLQRLQGIQNTNASTISLPITTNTNTVTGNVTKLETVLPHLMVMVVMLVAILLAALLILMEKKSKAQFRMFTMPISSFYHSCSMFFTVIMVVCAQIVIMLLLAHLFFRIDVLSSLLPTVILLLVSGCVFTCIGMGIGYLFSTQHTAMLAGVSVSSLFLLISDLILPLESMPQAMQSIMLYTPFVAASNALRSTLLFEGSLLSTSGLFWILLSYTLVFFIVITVLHKISHELLIINQHRKNR